MPSTCKGHVHIKVSAAYTLPLILITKNKLFCKNGNKLTQTHKMRVTVVLCKRVSIIIFIIIIIIIKSVYII